MSREAKQMALEALEQIHPGNLTPMAEEAWNKAITALRQALETEQEPVAWISEGGDVSRSKRYMDEMGFKCNPLYTAPPKREWVRLTEKEVKAIANKRNDYGLPMTGRMWVFVADLTDKLKEKNHG
jgi:hypothetical protein